MTEQKTGFPHELASALDKGNRALDAYLEVRSANQIAADIRSLISYRTPGSWDLYAAHAPVNSVRYGDEKATAALAANYADELLAEREKRGIK